MYVGDTVLVDDGGDREEWLSIASISAGVSITVSENLRYTHTAAQADTVHIKERKAGMDFYKAWDKMDFYVYGSKILQLLSNGNATLKGTLTENTAPTP